MIVGAQQFIFSQDYAARGLDWREHLPEILDGLVAAGIHGWEQDMRSREEAKQLERLLEEREMTLHSIYTGGAIHHPDWSDTVQSILEKALWTRTVGTRYVVFNPDPIDWSNPRDKDDEQLKYQAEALQSLGEALREHGLYLAYHSHAPEFRQGGREFHHMMLATDPGAVGLCADTHWLYRGCGHSQLALDGLLQLYRGRLVAFHLRQSHDGVWAETLEQGDIDYGYLAELLEGRVLGGPFVIELAREEGTPQTMGLVEAHRRSRQWIRETFAL
jgi:inosose dehydratase